MSKPNKYCKYYPCHKDLEDCTFCWCPFYPCLNKKLGYYIKKTWACDKCSWIHKKSVVRKIYKIIREETGLWNPTTR